MRAQHEQLAGGHTHKSRDELAEDGISGLGEGGFDGVKVEDSSGALISGQSPGNGSGRGTHTKLPMMVGTPLL